MISLKIGDCMIDILPVVKGLVSEANNVKEHYGRYEAYAVALGIESIEAIRRRSEIDEDDYELSEIDIVYAHKLSIFGEVQMPTPAFTELIDLCAKNDANVIPLDMDDNEFTTMYIENIKTMEFVKEHRLAKKAMKKKFNMTSPETFVSEWDRFLHGVKGYAKIDRNRELYIANQLADISKYRRSVLALIEIERADNVAELIRKRNSAE